MERQGNMHKVISGFRTWSPEWQRDSGGHFQPRQKALSLPKYPYSVSSLEVVE